MSTFSSKENAIRVSGAERSRKKRLLGQQSISSLLSAPISLLDQTIGWLYLLDKLDAFEFSEADERLTLTLAGQLAVAYENASLYADARDHASQLLAEVTERKQAQEEKERLLLSEKAARVEAEKAEQLSANLLMREEEARADAESANRLKDEFLATVSHELRTPLNSILGWSQLMRTGELDEESATRALHTIERNTRALAQIIDDLLDVSRIITGKLRLRPTDLRSVVEGALEAVKPATDAKNIRVDVSFDPAAGVVSGDSNRLQQIVWNLLSNAIKFTPAGGHVEARLERVGSEARVTIADSGEGINEEFLPFVFDRFRQADSSFTRMHGGLGLGLAIVRHLVELHGGTVGCRQQGTKQGLTFTVSFPLLIARGREPVHEQSSDASHLKPTQATDLSGLLVMIVDDESDAREVITAMLERCGAGVIAACSTAEAIDILAGATNGSMPHVLVSDIGMPGEDGIDLITRVRELAPERGGNIPAIALTAYARVEDRARVLAAGYQRHIAKPVEPATLATVVAVLARQTAVVS